jgi:hypothetical protein
MDMAVYELSDLQKEELKIEMLKDKFGYKLSFRELSFANELISDRELFERFKDQTFTDKDFIVSR